MRMSTRTASRGGTPNTNDKGTQDAYAKMVALEKELRLKDSQLEQVQNENKALSQAGKNKDLSLIGLTNQLIDTKQQISRLELEVAKKNEEEKQLFEEKKFSYSQGMGNIESLRTKEVETSKDGRGIVAPTDLYHHVMRLENELRDRDRVIGILKDENKTLDKLSKQRVEEFIIITDELQQAKSKLITSLDPVITENKTKELMQTIVDLQEENRLLLSIQKAKTQAIEDLTNELNRRGASETLLAQLKGEARAHDREVAKKDEEKARLQKIVEEQEAVMSKYRNEEVGVPVQMWMEERRLLQAEVQKHHEQRTQMEKTIKGQKDRINQLQENIDVIVKSYDGGKSPSVALRTHRRSKNLTGSSSLSNTLNSSLNSSLSDSGSMNNTMEGSSMFGNFSEIESSQVASSVVPSKLYEILERNVQRMSLSLSSKDTLLSEKDDALEMLEKKIDVMTKARATDNKKSKMTETELREEVTALKQMLSDVQSDAKERTQQLTLELTKLKRKPIKK